VAIRPSGSCSSSLREAVDSDFWRSRRRSRVVCSAQIGLWIAEETVSIWHEFRTDEKEKLAGAPSCRREPGPGRARDAARRWLPQRYDRAADVSEDLACARGSRSSGVRGVSALRFLIARASCYGQFPFVRL
jgi:hypothetical protein